MPSRWFYVLFLAISIVLQTSNGRLSQILPSYTENRGTNGSSTSNSVYPDRVKAGNLLPAAMVNKHSVHLKSYAVSKDRILNRRQSRAVKPINDATTMETDNLSDNDCKLELTPESINHFRHIVYYSESTYVYLRLNVHNGSNINITGSKMIVGENVWIWTFFGKEGSLEFLTWPEEFGIWSMGLLYNSVIRPPMNVTLQRATNSGDCSTLQVGTISADSVISNALKNLTLEMMQFDKEKYGPSFYCYKRRVYIQDENVYILCKHIVCPIEAISHSCCSFYYNKTLSTRVVGCREQLFQYDVLWWIIPSIISMILFVYSPILIMFIAYKCTEKEKGVVVLNPPHLANVVTNGDDEIENDEKEDAEVILLAGYRHVTLIRTLLMPFKCLRSKFTDGKPSFLATVIWRSTRVLIPVFSLSVIALQIVLDNYFLHDFVIESMKKGVPLGFRSMLGGYNESKLNFLPYLGGPFVAIALYVFVTGLLLILPDSPIDFVTRILRKQSDERSPLRLNLRTIGTMGTVRTTNRNGYSQFYHLLQAQFYMLLNYKFWGRCINIQTERWGWRTRASLIFLPIYICVCLVELIIATVFYACPIVSFAYYIVAGNVTHLYSSSHSAVVVKCCSLFLSAFLFCGIMYSMLMFGTIFLDATLFFTRVLIFTFTGVIIYPKTAYGYLIFGLTVFYYLWDSISDYASLYQQLFKDTVQAANSVQRANDSERIVHKVNGESGIRESLFEFVIEVHLPRRKQIFLSVLKAAIVLTVLWMLIHLLLTTDNFRELHVIMHVGTALFICALPQIAKTVCKGKENKKHQKRFRKDLAETIRVYMGYFVEDDESPSDSE